MITDGHSAGQWYERAGAARSALREHILRGADVLMVEQAVLRGSTWANELRMYGITRYRTGGFALFNLDSDTRIGDFASIEPMVDLLVDHLYTHTVVDAE